MDGRILWQLRDYIESKHGKSTWSRTLQTANLADRVYLAQCYPDTEAVALLTAAAAIIGKPVPAVLEDFGTFTVPFLLNMYRHILKPEWRTLDVIEHAERAAHGRVRQERPDSAPPFLRARRLSLQKLILTYNSPRKLCPMAVGVGIGLGRHFHEKITVRHGTCMHLGDPSCEIIFQRE